MQITNMHHTLSHSFQCNCYEISVALIIQIPYEEEESVIVDTISLITD